ncbi:MAG: Ig-like domain-containing protein, partial [Gammaproteobacteria bacterium]|nr:Ig-like domain-containing protein [Gammaproteobacteria bacterium]
TLDFQDGSQQFHSEEFSVEDNSPSLTFNKVSIADVEGQQFLVVEVSADDDVDMRHVGVDMTGLRASDLRSAGGVIAKAREQAFADTQGTIRVHPEFDGQTQFLLSVPVSRPLSPEAIASDGVVFLGLVAVDASGNQRATSTIAFTGDDVVEEATQLTASPTAIIFNNLLQTASIVPSVDFQFRGVTPLPGAGNGVRYSSSHPQLVAVTPGGLVYPLRETGGEAVSISVTFPGLDPVVIPVTVDITKQLTGLQVENLNAAGQFELERLNTKTAFPEVFGLFDDGSRLSVASQFELEYLPGTGASGILEVDAKGNLLARATVSEQSPVTVTVRLAVQPDVQAAVPVIARDALPDIDLIVPDSVESGELLQVVAEPSDDVDITEVRFFLDGSIMATATAAPYEVALTITDDLVNRTLKFVAVAVDSAGQTRESAEQAVRAVAKRVRPVPRLEWELPTNMQRVVEGAPILYQVARKLNFNASIARITHVDFLVDGTQVGSASFPRVEEREIINSAGETEKAFFEVWQLESNVEFIATETTKAFFAIIHSENGGTRQTESRVVRVIKNTSPSVRIISPENGANVSIGETLRVKVEFSDDTLPVGVDVDLFLNDGLLERFEYRDTANRFAHDAISFKTASRTFTIPIIEDMLGETLSIRAEVVDFHEKISKSSRVRVIPRADQAPNVALSHPVSGASFIAGLPIELRAEATDDVKIERVDFYVDGRLIGSDSRAPYTAVHETVEGLTREQTLTMFAVAVDNKEQTDTSAEVQVTLGLDEEPPVVNFASPPITFTEGGESLAEVVEDSEVVFKVTGFDNIGVNRLEVRGIKKEGTQFLLTGEPEDILSGEDFAPQQIPGTLRAYSSLKLIKVPLFKHAGSEEPGSGEGGPGEVERDRYPVEVTAKDETGNASTANMVIAVIADEDPEVVDVRFGRDIYFPRDKIVFDVQARDDRAVAQLEVAYFLGASSTPFATEIRNVNSGGDKRLVPAPDVQAGFEIDLVPFNLANASDTVRAEFRAVDNRGNRSDDNEDIFAVTVDIEPDVSEPLLGVNSPIQGSDLFRESTITVKWRAVDDSELEQVRFFADGQLVHTKNLSSSRAESSFNVDTPADGDELLITAFARDIYQNESETNWRFNLIGDQPPEITIRTPAPGSRLVEGEPFTLAAFISDNSKVDSATFFVEEDGVVLAQRSFSAKQIADAQTAGKPVSAGFRVPHRPESDVVTLELGVRATDDRGFTAEELLEIEILDDEEPPVVQLSEPQSLNISVAPGDNFKVTGSANDNVFINKITPVFINEADEEIILEWESLRRNDRTQIVRVPNPDSFGSVIAAQRFETDFEGKIRLPVSYLQFAGQVFKFIVRVNDLGINPSDSEPPINVTILADEEGPSIKILSPPNTVYDRQPVKAAVQISDNILLKSYTVFIAGQEGTPLASAQDVDKKSVDIKNLAIDLNEFTPISPEGKNFTVIVEAEDAAGNQKTAKRLVEIEPDNPPLLSVIDLPPDNPIQGGLLFHGLHAEDDYATEANPVSYFAVYTSLRGMQGIGGRDPTGAPDPFNPQVTFDYPESANLPGTLSLKGEPYVVTEAGKLSIRPRPIELSGRLKLDFGPNVKVRYHVSFFRDELCTLLDGESTIESPDGVNFNSLVAGNVTAAIIQPELLDAATGEVIPNYIRAIRIDSRNVKSVGRYAADAGRERFRSVSNKESFVTVLLDDTSSGDTETAMLAAGTMIRLSQRSKETGHALPVPVNYDIRSINILGYAVDRFANERPAQPVPVLSIRRAERDEIGPDLIVTAPANGSTVIPLKRFDIKVDASDNTTGVRSIQLFENRDRLVREIGGRFGVNGYKIPYEVPRDITGGNLELLLVATDNSGQTATKLLTLPVAPNEDPELAFTKFSSYKVNGKFQKVLDSPERLNFAEFFVRVGENFRLDTRISDDAGLKSFVINRLDRFGGRFEEFREDYANTCPSPTVTAATPFKEILFEQPEPTEYEVIVEDTFGNKVTRTFLVHPLTNMTPGIRITSPAEGQPIVAGTFQVKVGIVATDDRLLSTNDIEVFANGRKLGRIGNNVLRGSNEIGGTGAIEQAFDSMFDDIEANYSVALADEFGRRNSPFAVETGFVMSIPSGLVRSNEPLEIKALIRDSDGAVARHEIEMEVAADEINPEIAVTRPGIDFGAFEASNFTFGFRAFDNVKVEQLQLFRAYGVRLEDSDEYITTDFGLPIRSISSVESRDFVPVTTVNIDTPEFLHVVSVDRLKDIIDQFPDLDLTGAELFDVWLKIVVRDAEGNSRTREVRFPVRIDERPVVDIVSPAPGVRKVESTPLTVNVEAFDDVGIGSVRLVATHSKGDTEIFNILLRQPPYGFSVSLPAFDPDVPENNRVTLRVEAIDTYGVTFDDPDKHSAFEEITIEIIEDKPPAVLIGKPVNDEEITEGEFMLVQVNGVDDVGLDRVVLQVAGLITGDRVFTDTSFPYEYLVEIPYGQAGKDLSLTASAVEKRFGGEPRTAVTPAPTTVRIRKDTIAPEIIVIQPPASGATVVESRSVNYALEVSDDVRVSTVQLSLFADSDLDDSNIPDKSVALLQLLSPPYTGSIALQTIEDYLDKSKVSEEVIAQTSQLNLELRILARDGAGNTTTLQPRPITLVRNAPPEVKQIQVLDARGFNLGPVTEITEGRGIIIHVIASDPEVGVDSARLFQRIGPPGDDGEYTLFGEDNAVPFQYQMQVPIGRAGDVMSFRADATDVDGNQSTQQGLLNLTIIPDEPPQAEIVKPANNQSAIIEGQDIEVFVEAIDDLGPDGIDRVVFYVNDTPVETVVDSLSKQTGSFAQEHIYRALITPPEGVDGFVIYAVAFDIIGHSAQTKPVRIGTVEDTVAPRLAVIRPFQGEILTTAEAIEVVATVDDIGDAALRRVFMRFERQRQLANGEWVTIEESGEKLFDEIELLVDIAQSDPDNNHFVYTEGFVDDDILARNANFNERVLVTTRVETPNHTVESETTHEVGLPVSERRFLLPTDPGPDNIPSPGQEELAKSVYYTAVDQFKNAERTGAMIGAWATADPMRVEQGLGNAIAIAGETPRSGLFLLDDTGEFQAAGGDHFVFSELLVGASEIFAGTIGEIHADAD